MMNTAGSAKQFAFRSDLSPADCAKRITELTGLWEDQGEWIGSASPVKDKEEYYRFQLYLQRDRLKSDPQNPKTVHVSLVGTIERNDALGSSFVSGKLYSSPAFHVYSFFTILWIMVMVVMLVQDGMVLASNGVFWCMGIFIFLLTGTMAWTAWTDQARTITRLERCLQASYRVQKK